MAPHWPTHLAAAAGGDCRPSMAVPSPGWRWARRRRLASGEAAQSGCSAVLPHYSTSAFDCGHQRLHAWSAAAAGQRHRAACSTAGLLVLTYWSFVNTPTGFIPSQDKGYLLVNVQLPDGASLERTRAGHAANRAASPGDPRRQAHRGHLRAIDPAQRQRAQFRRDVRHARRFSQAAEA